MRKTGQELVVDPGAPGARERVLSALKRGLAVGAGVGVGAGLGTLSSHLLGERLPAPVTRHMPAVMGGLGAGLMFLDQARRAQVDKMKKDELEQKMLLRVSGADEAGRVRDVLQQSAPAKNRFKVYLSHGDTPQGDYRREVVLQPGVSEEQIRKTVWGE